MVGIFTSKGRVAVLMGAFDYWYVCGVDYSCGRDAVYERLALLAKCRLYEALPDASDAYLARKERLFRRLLERWARNW